MHPFRGRGILRVLMEKPFPDGDFICSLCEEIEQEYQKEYAGN